MGPGLESGAALSNDGRGEIVALAVEGPRSDTTSAASTSSEWPGAGHEAGVIR